MINVEDTNLYIGSLDDFYHLEDNEDWAFVHVTRVVYFHLLQQWLKEGVVSKDSGENPLIITHENRMAIDWPDGSAAVFERGGPEAFEKIFNFIDKWIDERKVLVHCDEGVSRSPTVVMTYLAKRTDILPDDFGDAREGFTKIHPHYMPGGIEEFIEEHWVDIE